jgi:hypothetical protein
MGLANHRDTLIWDADENGYVPDNIVTASLSSAVYSSESYSSLFEAIAVITTEVGSGPAELIISTASFPDGDKVIVPANITLTFEGEGSLYTA